MKYLEKSITDAKYFIFSIPRQLLASQSILQHGVIQSALIGWYSGSDIKTSVDPENSGLK